MILKKKENTLIVLIGPTCSKKSSLAYALRKEFNCDIVNCDIFKAYKLSDYWVNQIPNQRINDKNYHLYSFLNIEEKMNVAIYQKIARKKIKELLKKNSVVLIGGSCLYMNSIVYKEYKFNNIGKQKKPHKFTNFFTNTKYIGLMWNREELYTNINKRVDNFFNKGLDVPKLIVSKYYKTTLAKAIGYKEWKSYFENKSSKKEVLEIIKKNTRNFAKRQLTWFNNQYDNVTWYFLNHSTYEKKFIEIIKDFQND